MAAGKPQSTVHDSGAGNIQWKDANLLFAVALLKSSCCCADSAVARTHLASWLLSDPKRKRLVDPVPSLPRCRSPSPACSQGIARVMLEACDAAVRTRGQQVIWLHVRQADQPAQQLYSGYGYAEVDREKPGGFAFQALLGGNGNSQRSRILMKRQISSTGQLD